MAKGDRDAASHPEELRASREIRILRPRDLRQSAESCSVRFDLRGETSRGFGVAGNAEAMAIRERSARVDGLVSTKQRTKVARQNGAKTQRDRRPFE